MFLEVVTPEAILFSGEVDSVAVPGVDGEFEMLNNHAPVVSLLKKGTVRIKGANETDFKEEFSSDGSYALLPITSGTIELNENKIMILAD